ALEPRLRPIGQISSVLKTRSEAPKQGSEGAPDAWLEVHSWAAEGLDGLAVGDEIVVITWFHHSNSSRIARAPEHESLDETIGWVCGDTAAVTIASCRTRQASCSSTCGHRRGGSGTHRPCNPSVTTWVTSPLSIASRASVTFSTTI